MIEGSGTGAEAVNSKLSMIGNVPSSKDETTKEDKPVNPEKAT
jgi:hypothetical protein